MPIKYYPEDEQDYSFIGIKFPTNGNVSSNGGFFNMSRTTEEQSVTNYINLLLTKKGERYMQPTYGINLPSYLFEPNTQALRTELEFEIRNQCSIWMPHIINHSIDVRERGDIPGLSGTDTDNSIQIVITFSVQNKGANKTITFFQTQGRIQYLEE